MHHSSFILPLFALSCSVQAAPLPSPHVDDAFWSHWGDGQAELVGYRLHQPRYAVPRKGEAVWVFVTENTDPTSRVKTDGRGGIPVLKLNDTRDFQTGVYDYNVMTSSFVALDGSRPLGVPVKVSFSSQEWCGHVYEQLIPRDGQLERVSHSYFEGEADQTGSSALPEGTLLLDAIPATLRGPGADWLAVGATESVQVYDRLMDLRFEHNTAKIRPGTIRRERPDEAVVVPAGSFEVDRYTLNVGPRSWSWDLERAMPHRIVRFTGPGGEVGEMTGSIRSPYWNKNREGNEALREQLGLRPPSWLRP